MLRVALTGGIATGKIYVLARLKDRGIPTIDADDIVHEALGPGTPTANAIATQFGQRVPEARWQHRSGAARGRVFGDRETRRGSSRSCIRLSTKPSAPGSTHWIGPSAWRRFRSCTKPAAIMIFDVVVVTVCPPDMQLQRLLDRGMSEEEAQQRIAAQMPAEEKAARGRLRDSHRRHEAGHRPSGR